MPLAASMRRARLTWTSLRLHVQAFARTAGKSDARSIRQSLVFAWRDGTVCCGGAIALVSSRTSSSKSHVLPSPRLLGIPWEFLRRFEFEGSRHCGGVICFQCTFLFRRVDRCPRRVSGLRPRATFLPSIRLAWTAVSGSPALPLGCNRWHLLHTRRPRILRPAALGPLLPARHIRS